jgi:hypothetical protein
LPPAYATGASIRNFNLSPHLAQSGGCCAILNDTAKTGVPLMRQQVLIEFVVDVPNEGVARDVETRIRYEHLARLCDELQSVTGYEPLRAPGQRGLYVTTEPVTWSPTEQEWVALDDDGSANG